LMLQERLTCFFSACIHFSFLDIFFFFLFFFCWELGPG
jgi:hypothetical protein